MLHALFLLASLNCLGSNWQWTSHVKSFFSSMVTIALCSLSCLPQRSGLLLLAFFKKSIPCLTHKFGILSVSTFSTSPFLFIKLSFFSMMIFFITIHPLVLYTYTVLSIPVFWALECHLPIAQARTQGEISAVSLTIHT